MNTPRKIKTRRPLFSPIVVTLLVGIVVGLVSGGPSAEAQTTSTTEPSSVKSSVTISASGTVNDPNGAISVSGYVIVNSTRVIDATLESPPLVVLDFDFSNLRGTSGIKNSTLYVTGGNQATEIRPLNASDVIMITCPYYASSDDILSAKSWLVTATLNFDVSTGKLTSGSVTVKDKPAASEAVGGVTASIHRAAESRFVVRKIKAERSSRERARRVRPGVNVTGLVDQYQIKTRRSQI